MTTKKTKRVAKQDMVERLIEDKAKSLAGIPRKDERLDKLHEINDKLNSRKPRAKVANKPARFTWRACSHCKDQRTCDNREIVEGKAYCTVPDDLNAAPVKPPTTHEEAHKALMDLAFLNAGFPPYEPVPLNEKPWKYFDKALCENPESVKRYWKWVSEAWDSGDYVYAVARAKELVEHRKSGLPEAREVLAKMSRGCAERGRFLTLVRELVEAREEIEALKAKVATRRLDEHYIVMHTAFGVGAVYHYGPMTKAAATKWVSGAAPGEWAIVKLGTLEW